MTTPEGRVKAKIKKVLDKFPNLYIFMPVPSGYGKSSLDFVLCAKGFFFAIEAKAPGNKPTPRQWGMIEDIQRAGGIAMVISDDGGCQWLEERLSAIYECSSKSKAQSGGSAGCGSTPELVSQ